jgi:hypothetical protein
MENLIRKCPECDNIIEYKNKYILKESEKKNRKCKSCSRKGENNPMFGKKGNLNPFFGKKHSEESKNKIRVNKNYETYKTIDFKDKMSKINKGENNPMFGKSFYDVWVKRYGVDIANKKMIEYKEKQSFNNKGENNSMYGKPSPNGSGNGWSGWYKGWFFRSIKELTYMIKVIERFNLEWETGENKKYVVEYCDYKGNKRNYFPDFIISNKYVVEIKPKKLFKSDLVVRKKNAASLFYEKINLKYKLISIDSIPTNEIIELYNEKKIIFTEKYEKKFIKMFLQSSN